jgi:hypothetical protein
MSSTDIVLFRAQLMAGELQNCRLPASEINICFISTQNRFDWLINSLLFNIYFSSSVQLLDAETIEI